MNIQENKNTNSNSEKNFSDSQLNLSNRKILNISGVEKIYESNESKIQLKVASSFLCVLGENLNINQLNLDDGLIQVEGIINSLNYENSSKTKNFFKKIFK